MKFKNPIKSYMRKQVEAGIKEFKESLPASGGVDADDYQYKRLTGASSRDLEPLTQDRIIEIAYKLYDQNPLAHNFIELIKDYVIGSGITFTATDDKVKTVLDDFWKDPVNNWEVKQHDRSRELSLWGEQLYPVFVDDVKGRVRMGNIDPAEIDKVFTKPGNVEITDRITLVDNPSESKKREPLKIIQIDDGREGTSKTIATNKKSGKSTFNRLVGDAFYFTINTVSNGTRGKPDLLNGADWFDLYDQFLWSEAERANFLRAFVWDVTLTGMNEAQIKEWIKNNPAPKPGSVSAHNENVEWKAITPQLNAKDAEILARLIRNQIGIGLGFSEIFSGMGGDVNRATAAEMGDPTIKRMQSRQAYFKFMITQIFRFVIDQAIIHNTLSEDVDTTFTVVMSPIKLDDEEKASKVIKAITDSLAMAQQNGWISQEKATEVFSVFMERLGIEYDPKEEGGKVGDEDEDDEEQDIKKLDLAKEKKRAKEDKE